ncbi:MAG: hypothetical protein B6D61_10585, partial [Bacteroidetes bacterium 4484_249]
MINRISILLFIISFLTFQGFAEDYYWVGGQGIWSDLNSWRTISGTIPNEVPDASDNVIFNENSFLQPFDTVFILTQNPVCKNMTWENIQDTVVIFGGSDQTAFSIYNSITFCPNVVNEYIGKILFMSQEQGNTITCAGTRFAGNIWFDGTGEWILQDTLLVIDTTNWESIVLEAIEPKAPNPFIIHNNGTLNTNNQVVFSRGFNTQGNLPRELIIENSDFYNIGPWTLSGESLTFNAQNSYILMFGEMNNYSAELIIYNDIDFLPGEGAIKNTDIRTEMRKVHFLGSGSIDGKLTPIGQEGSFTIDTLLFDGYIDPMAGPIPCVISGIYNDIHYTRIDLVMGYVNEKESNYHRIDYNGDNGAPGSYFEGFDNELDSIHFNSQRKKGKLFGSNTVNDLLFFNTEGIVSAYMGEINIIDHAVFKADGHFGGNNSFDLVTLSSGFWYQLQADSLIFPGSIYSDTYTQTINKIEVSGGCNNGLSLFTSSQKTVQARVNYTGDGYSTEYLSVRDIKNVGSDIIVEHGIDIANNVGFVFTNPLEARTLYWVGGTGDWNDNNNWSLSSGAAGGHCPPTILDDVYFDVNSFSADGEVVNCNVKYACMNDLIWDGITGLPILSGPDTNNLRIWGSVKLTKDMSYKHWGRVFFESEDDNDWETIDLSNTYIDSEGNTFPAWHLFNQTWFYGAGGKWELQSKMYNMSDTLFLEMGELKMTNDTVGAYNFSSTDTLTKGLYLLDKTLFEVHQYNADAWVLNAFGINKVIEPNFVFDAGRSTIRTLGDISPPPGAPPGISHIRTYAGEVTYHNIEFGDTIISGIKSMLKSESLCHYNLVDYYVKYGDAVGNGTIDTLTYKQHLNSDGTLISAEGCKIKNVYEINFVMAESPNDTLIGNHIIDSVFFFENGGTLFGYHNIGYLQADKFSTSLLENTIDTAVYYGNAHILGSTTYSQLVLSPNKRYFFEHDKTHTIIDDFVVNGNCDAPIRFQSDSIGTIANILYKAQNPSNTDFTANYASFRDINMVDFDGNEYIAENSIDLGNNTNWTFIETDDDVYYWIGGNGNWGDWSHWSFESGGAAIDGICTPKEINTVIFDDNSFNTPSDTIFIDVLNAYCKDMYWRQSDAYNPVFSGPDTSVLYIYGSLKLSENMDYQYYGDIYFDQYNEPGYVADTITTNGRLILSDFHFQGIDDVVYLNDDLTMFVDAPNFIFNNVILEHGGLVINGNHLNCGKVYSVFKNQRILNIENSKVTVKYESAGQKDKRAWFIDGDNLEFFANNSTIYDSAYESGIVTLNGDYFKYHNIVLDNFGDSLANFDNIVEYNVISMNVGSGKAFGNFIADSILMRGKNSEIIGKSTTNLVILDSLSCWIKGTHDIKKAFVNKFGYIQGTNEFEYCVFNSGGMFFEENLFDTLILYPGQGNFENQGNWFFFETGKTQTIVDSLYIRGNQCSNIN